MSKADDRVEKAGKRIGEVARSAEDVPRLFADLRAAFDRELATAHSTAEVESLRVRWLGRKAGLLNQVKNNWLLHAAAELKPQVGKQLNALREHVEHKVSHTLDAILARTEVSAEAVDLTLPGVAVRRGARHLITQTMEEICDIFRRLGFSAVEGPEIETAYYNFEALNMPAHHPARDMWDTLYLNLPGGAEPLLLRTHTSPMQIRVMEKQKPPVRVVVPGKVYRHDNPDASHSFMFHQIEGLAVDCGITFGHLKGVLDHFLREFFGPETRTRFVPSYFPFTEPSADVHGSCHVCRGAGCRVCKFTGWIELVGCGMVDPNVYGFVGYDARELSGFAFGMGVERFAMLKYGIDDIQLFFQNDVRFLTQFRR